MSVPSIALFAGKIIFSHRQFYRQCPALHNPVYSRCYQEIHTFHGRMGIRWDGHRHQKYSHNLSISNWALRTSLAYLCIVVWQLFLASGHWLFVAG
jgi:hypothetical protein